mmetsp:Transcript_18197/g.49933  ORF Transcript_18197/g.49933 Transcript_18197/m.49933 type:complete len:175 (-) Transcript_18197:60-584(-)
MTFKIYMDNDLVGLAEETSRGFDSVTFRDVRNSTGALMGSSILKERHFHGAYDLWLAKSEAWGSLPYWVLDAATLLFAYNSLNSKGAATPYPPTYFNAEPPADAKHTALQDSSSDTAEAEHSSAAPPMDLAPPASLAPSTKLASKAETPQAAPSKGGSDIEVTKGTGSIAAQHV